MTIKDIAEAAGCHYSTVRDTVERLFPGTVHHGKQCQLDATKAAAVMMELPKRNMVELSGKPKSDSLENQRLPAPKLRLPSGAQLEALRHIYPAADLAKRIDYILGYPLTPIEGKVYNPRETPENPVDRALVATGLKHMGAAARLTPADWDNARRTAIAAGQRSLNDAAARIAAERKQGRLIP